MKRRRVFTQRTLTIGGSIIVRLTSCLSSSDLTDCSFNTSKAAESNQNNQ